MDRSPLMSPWRSKMETLDLFWSPVMDYKGIIMTKFLLRKQFVKLNYNLLMLIFPYLPKWDLLPEFAAQSKNAFQKLPPDTGESVLCSPSSQHQILQKWQCTDSASVSSSGCSSCRRWRRCVAATRRSSCRGTAWSARPCRSVRSDMDWLRPERGISKHPI